MGSHYPQSMSQQMGRIECPHDPGTEGGDPPETQHAVDAGLALDRLARYCEPLGRLAATRIELSLEAFVFGVSWAERFLSPLPGFRVVVTAYEIVRAADGRKAHGAPVSVGPDLCVEERVEALLGVDELSPLISAKLL